MDHEAHIDRLIAKLDAGTITPAERETLVSWYNSFDDSAITVIGTSPDSPEALKARMYARLMARIQEQRHMPASTPHRSPTRWRWFAAAAAILIAVTATWLVLGDGWSALGYRQLAAQEILPGGNRATLTLADGRMIDLSSEQEGIVIQDGITYLDGSNVSGDSVNEGVGNGTHSPTNSLPPMLALTTPKGGTYRITLPDGSNVWLNANSTLKYPNRFSGDTREVILEGEAFFAVSSQLSAINDQQSESRKGPKAGKRLPFRVVTKGQTVEVLGTQFNVSAYPDQSATKTALVEGSVRIKANAESLQLLPGELGTATDDNLTKRKTNIEPFIAWKNGYFFFDAVPLSTVMRQLAQWYDVEPNFEDAVQDELFYGKIARNKNLGQVLKILENTKTVRFRVQGKRLYITKR